MRVCVPVHSELCFALAAPPAVPGPSVRVWVCGCVCVGGGLGVYLFTDSIVFPWQHPRLFLVLVCGSGCVGGVWGSGCVGA